MPFANLRSNLNFQQGSMALVCLLHKMSLSSPLDRLAAKQALDPEEVVATGLRASKGTLVL